MRAARHFLALVVAVALVAGADCAAQDRAGLRVFAASSLTDALNELGDKYQETAGGPAPAFNFAASSVLAHQIGQGADADLFISADEPWMDYLEERALLAPGTRVNLLSNRLVLIAPRKEPIAIDIREGFDLKGALRGGKLAIANPDSVPAGKYAKAALASLGAWGSLKGSVVYAENVRAALRFVELGEAAAAVVYLTDARASDRVAVVGEFPSGSHPEILYPMAVVRDGRRDEARAFAEFLRSDAADSVFSRSGFIVLAD